MLLMGFFPGEDMSSDRQQAMGKLEMFLLTFRPEHYDALVAAGVLKLE